MPEPVAAARTIKREGMLAVAVDRLTARMCEEKGAALQMRRVMLGHARWTRWDLTRLAALALATGAQMARDAIREGRRPGFPKPPAGPGGRR